jgi:hypothetical protein
MEKELGQIEKRQEFEQNKVTTTLKGPRHLKMMSEREATEVARHGEVQRWSSDSEGDEVPIAQTLETEPDSTTTVENSVKHIEAVGIKVAKDFGSLGVYFGSVLAVEYDSDDDSKAKPFYCVQYTDGDKEDLNEDEFGFARELCIQTLAAWMKTASIPSSRKPSRRHLCALRGKSPKKESLLSLRIVRPKGGSYPKCFESCRISWKSDTSRRPLHRLRTMSVAHAT